MTRSKNFYCGLGFCLLSSSVWAAQSGPLFPTHRFPTDQSMHLGYSYGYFNTTDNYSDSQASEALPDSAKVNRSRHTILAEYQADRNISTGVYILYDKIKLSSDAANEAQRSALSDQYAFGEYRYYDKPGASLGLAMMIKFPLYSNPTYESLVSAKANSVALLGDAQTDFTLMATSEIWPINEIRARADLGYTYRTEHYSGEFPFQVSIAYVTPRLDFEVKLGGNLSQKNDDFDPTTSEIDKVRTLFGSSEYAYAKDPMTVYVNPNFEYWLNKNWAFGISYKQTLMGQNAPVFWETQGGLTYRWALTEKAKKKVKEVDISTDQEEGVFQGEQNSKRKGDISSEELPPEEEKNKKDIKSDGPEEQIPED